MTFTPQWFGGEYPYTSAGGSVAVGDGVQDGTLARETTIVTGSWSDVSFKMSLDSAGEVASTYPMGKNGQSFVLNAARIGMTFAMRMSDTTPADFVDIVVGVYSGAAFGTPSRFRHATDGDLDLVSADGTVYATATTPFTADTWAYYMVTAEYDSGADTLRHRMWKWSTTDPTSGTWGTAIIDHTESSSAVTDLDTLYLRFSGNILGVNPATDYYCDDMSMWTFDSDSDFPSKPFTVQRLVPDGNSGVNASFTEAGTGSNPDFADVDDDVMDGDTTYDECGSTAVQERQAYTLEACPSLNAGDTTYVSAISGWKMTGGANGAQINVVDNATSTDSGTNGNTSTASYTTQQWCMALAPSDSSAWTQTRIDGLEVGARKGGLAGRTVRLTIAYALVARIVVPAAATTTQQGPVLVGAAAGVSVY